ncbi:MAG TPA: cytochrome c3 family protein [Stellaceae bacterium]|nr:cytochrome c3 family protein [Stellaceae bacterium]
MEVDVTVLTRRGAAVMRRTQRASAPRIGLGRGTDNEVPLADIRVGLHIAALVPRADGIAIEKLGVSPLIVNGESVETAVLKPGAEILLGPYRIEMLPPPEGCDGAIQIELVQPMGAALERLTASARIGIERAGFGKRVLAWSGFLLIAVVCLAVPIVMFSSGKLQPWHKERVNKGAATLVGLSWNTGSFSNAHRFFGADCATCHQGAFNRVSDESCLACHTNVGNHAEHGVNLGSAGDKLAALRCVDCHTEHRGIDGIVIHEARFCLGCHRNLADTAPDTHVPDIGGWPNGHPQFRVTVVADAATSTMARVSIGATPPPMDHPGLKFSHAAHLVRGGFPVLHYKEMVCADCHLPEPSGQGFQPITYKNQCESCHELAFDKVALPWPNAKVPHGDDTGVIAAVWNYYAGLALEGGASAAPLPAAVPVERRGAGTSATAPASSPADDTRGWVNAKSLAALRVVFDERRGCAYCHYSTSADGSWDTDKILADALPPKANPPHVVAPVMLRTRFLPLARFDHASHRGMSCEDCHASRTAQTSNEVLIPGIDNCVKCHGTERASLRSQSTCITCHIFHRPEFGLMRMTAGATQ